MKFEEMCGNEKWPKSVRKWKSPRSHDAVFGLHRWWAVARNATADADSKNFVAGELIQCFKCISKKFKLTNIYFLIFRRILFGIQPKRLENCNEKYSYLSSKIHKLQTEIWQCLNALRRVFFLLNTAEYTRQSWPPDIKSWWGITDDYFREGCVSGFFFCSSGGLATSYMGEKIITCSLRARSANSARRKKARSIEAYSWPII